MGFRDYERKRFFCVICCMRVMCACFDKPSLLKSSQLHSHLLNSPMASQDKIRSFFVALIFYCTFFNACLFFSCVYCYALNWSMSKCQVCKLTACGECFANQDWLSFCEDYTSVCKDCRPVLKGTRRFPSPSKPYTPARRAKNEQKFQKRLAKNKARIAKKNAVVAAKLEKDSKLTPEALARKQEAQLQRKQCKYAALVKKLGYLGAYAIWMSSDRLPGEHFQDLF